MTSKQPLFVVLEPASTDAATPVKRVSWASKSEIGVAARARLTSAAGALARQTRLHDVFMPDPLFDEPRLWRFLIDRGYSPGGRPRDWMLALAPFGQARNLSAILAEADALAPPENPAARLFEAWRIARERATR